MLVVLNIQLLGCQLSMDVIQNKVIRVLKLCLKNNFSIQVLKLLHYTYMFFYFHQVHLSFILIECEHHTLILFTTENTNEKCLKYISKIIGISYRKDDRKRIKIGRSRLSNIDTDLPNTTLDVIKDVVNQEVTYTSLDKKYTWAHVLFIEKIRQRF